MLTRILLRVATVAFAMALSYEVCMNASFTLWAHSRGTLEITELTATGWMADRIVAKSAEARSIRLISSQPRVWYPMLVGFVPAIAAKSDGVTVGFGGNTIFGGKGALPGGGFWMFFPYGGAASLTASEQSAMAKWEPIEKEPRYEGKARAR